MGRRKGFNNEFRKRWALSAIRREGSIVSLAREAGVSEQTMYRWRDLFIEGGSERLSGSVSPEREEIERLKKELAGRDQVISEQKIAIRVLTKMFGKLKLSDELKTVVKDELLHVEGKNRLNGVLRCLGISSSTWYQ